MKLVVDLFLTFLKIGAFSFGGGYAMLPFMEREIVQNHQWLSNQQFLDIIAISQMTPGPVAINSATFVGYKVAGVWGSIFSTLGVVMVSFILVTIATKAISKFKDSNIMKAALVGMRPALIGLIISAFISLAKVSYCDVKSIIITLIVGGCLFSKKIHPIASIGIAAILGIIFYI